jgi:hypothetical protein
MKWRGSGLIGLVLMLLAFWQCNRDSTIEINPTKDTCNSIPLNDQGVVILEMPQPFFSEDSGAVAYGTKVLLHADSMPNPGIYEMSLDSGKSWKALECLLLPTSLELWGRTRYKDVVSPITKVNYSVYYERVLIVGNSIMRHEPLPEKAWHGNWGMAASVPENDFVHLLTTKLKKLNPNVEIRLMEAVDFERNYQKYDFSKLTKEAAFSPTLLIMRIAENSNLNTLSAYENRYDQLIQRLTAQSDHCKVICTTSFWPSTEEASWPIRSVARNKGYCLADLYDLSQDKTLAAYSFFEDFGVGSHPSDKGMKAIADKISAFF